MRGARVEDDPAAGGGGDGGLVVANDMEPKRMYMLATHTRRIEPRVHDDNDSIIL